MQKLEITPPQVGFVVASSTHWVWRKAIAPVSALQAFELSNGFALQKTVAIPVSPVQAGFIVVSSKHTLWRKDIMVESSAEQVAPNGFSMHGLALLPALSAVLPPPPQAVSRASVVRTVKSLIYGMGCPFVLFDLFIFPQ